MIEVSVIVPVYNVEKYLRKCLDSILNQTHDNFEVILVDDGSSDHSGVICDEYQKKDGRVKVIHQSNQGVAKSRNNGLDASSGEYVYFCDPDDYLENNLIKENVVLIKKNNANLVIFGYYDEKITKKGEKLLVRAPQKDYFLQTKNEFRREFNQLYSLSIMYTLWNKLYRKAYLLHNNCMFENVGIGEDTRFNINVYKDLDKVFINKKRYYHYIVQRYNSAANKYRPDGFDIRYKEIELLKNLMEYWGYEKINEDLIRNEWILTLVIGVKSLFYKQCPLNEHEKKQKISEFINRPELKKTLENLKFNQLSGSFREKIKKFLFANADKSFIFILLKNMYKLR